MVSTQSLGKQLHSVFCGPGEALSSQENDSRFIMRVSFLLTCQSQIRVNLINRKYMLQI